MIKFVNVFTDQHLLASWLYHLHWRAVAQGTIRMQVLANSSLHQTTTQGLQVTQMGNSSLRQTWRMQGAFFLGGKKKSQQYLNVTRSGSSPFILLIQPEFLKFTCFIKLRIDGKKSFVKCVWSNWQIADQVDHRCSTVVEGQLLDQVADVVVSVPFVLNCRRSEHHACVRLQVKQTLGYVRSPDIWHPSVDWCWKHHWPKGLSHVHGRLQTGHNKLASQSQDTC